ncbi:MAG: type II toxin-antitoxin system prevent-host-death family antitoxin [Spirochaetales bacterium]|nr:type II toxin-antitoxin system prevent-host-death family antitoxin [Spirochaetales bacterium]
MMQILSEYTVSISELKKNPSSLIEQSHGSAIAVLNHNKPTAYLVPADTYEKMMELLSDIKLSRTVTERLKDTTEAIEVDFADL